MLRVVRPMMLFVKNKDAQMMLLTLIRTIPTFLSLVWLIVVYVTRMGFDPTWPYSYTLEPHLQSPPL